MQNDPVVRQFKDTPVVLEVIRDLTNRAEEGRKKYRTYLYPNNTRNALLDAYEEALDLCMYLKQALMEQDSK